MKQANVLTAAEMKRMLVVIASRRHAEAALTPETTADRKKELDQKLRIYCGQDTWAMVEIAYFLAQAGRPTRPMGA